jgi:TnpA family transposase
MPRKSLLSQTEYDNLVAFPECIDEIIQHYTFSESDLSLINQRRGEASKFGFAFMMCAMRYPGIAPETAQPVPPAIGEYIQRQTGLPPSLWERYAKRPATRWEHILELKKIFGFISFTDADYERFLGEMTVITSGTDKALAVAKFLVESLRREKVLLPSRWTINQLCAEALTVAAKKVYDALTAGLTEEQILSLEQLLEPDGMHKNLSRLTWLSLPPLKLGPKHILTHINRVKSIEDLKLTPEWGQRVHRNWLLKLSDEGRQMTSQHLRELESARRRATLVAICIELSATLIDEIIELHDRYIRQLWSSAQRKSVESLESNSRSASQLLREFTDVMNALIEAHSEDKDLEDALENVTTWEDLSKKVESAWKINQPKNFNHLASTRNSYSVIRRYAPEMLESLNMKTRAPHCDLLDALGLLKSLDSKKERKIPAGAPQKFIPKKWQALVIGKDCIDRQFYELCALSELKNSLRSGDIWVEGSNLHRDFENYLLPKDDFEKLKAERRIPVSVTTGCEEYLNERLAFLKQQMETVAILANKGELEDAAVTKSGFKISPLKKTVPDEAETLQQRIYSILPRVKITDLLLEVEQWTGFSKAFRHIKDDSKRPDKLALLSVILSDGLNMGLRKMADSCPGMTYPKLSWTQSWYVREETYSSALAALVDAQHILPFARYWGDGTTSSSDGQQFPTTWGARASGEVNMKYGSDPGKMIYTHISDQNMGFHTRVVSPVKRDHIYVMDGLLHHNTSLQIAEHYTDTSGFTDHIFAMLHFLGFRFAPRIRDFKDKKLYIPKDCIVDPIFAAIIGGRLDTDIIRSEWDEILRLHASLRLGTTLPSLIIHKLSSFNRQNSLSKAIRELGKIERTLFMLDWVQNKNLRHRVQIGLNKGEARNFLARSLFENRNGEMRDRTWANQQNRASSLSLIIAAIGLWNTVYIEKSVQKLEKNSHKVKKDLLQHISPLGWGHIILNGDYIWRALEMKTGEYRSLRPIDEME